MLQRWAGLMTTVLWFECGFPANPDVDTSVVDTSRTKDVTTTPRSVATPKAAVVNPNAVVVKPNAAVVKPKASVVKPGASVVKPKASVVNAAVSQSKPPEAQGLRDRFAAVSIGCASELGSG